MSKASEIYLKWKEHCRHVAECTVITVQDTPEIRSKRISKALRNYDFFVNYYFPHYATDPCAWFHKDAAHKIKSDPNIFAVLEWPREHAKSVHADIMIPMWLKACHELSGMVLVGKNEGDACNLLSGIQAEFENNARYISDFGPQKQTGSWEEGEFITQDDILFVGYGRGQSPRGVRNKAKRPNYCVVDDVDDDELVQNLERVEKVVDYLLGSLYGAIDIRQSRMVIVGNRIHPRSVLAHIVGDIEEGKPKRPGIWHSKVMATVDGTFTGQPQWPEKYTSEQLQKRFERMGYYLANREYFHKAVIKGKIFKNEWIHWGKIPQLRNMDAIVAYFDPSYKPKTTNDFKAIKIWGKKALNLYNIDAFCKQSTMTEAVQWLYDFHESLPTDVICDYYMEDVFLQDMFFEDFALEAAKRGYYLPIRGDKRQKPDKFSRIQAIAPLWERGFVTYNSAKQKSQHMIMGVEQTLGFQKGASIHDDGPDADEGAIWILQKRGRVEAQEPKFGLRKQRGW